MATVNLTPTLGNARARAEFWTWSGTQDLIGNTIRWTIPTAYRPITHITLNLKGSDTPTPGGSGMMYLKSQAGDATYEHIAIGRWYGAQIASVQAAGATYAWLRASVNPTFLSATGCILTGQFNGESTATPIHISNGVMIHGSAIVIEMNCDSLTGVALVTRMGIGITFAD